MDLQVPDIDAFVWFVLTAQGKRQIKTYIGGIRFGAELDGII